MDTAMADDFEPFEARVNPRPWSEWMAFVVWQDGMTPYRAVSLPNWRHAVECVNKLPKAGLALQAALEEMKVLEDYLKECGLARSASYRGVEKIAKILESE